MTRFASWQLFAASVLTWGTTWHAITYQLAYNPADVGVALRFALAAGAVLALCAWRRLPLRFGRRDHARFALQGAFMYGVAYICVYQAERHLPSGLVAVGYSASPLLAGVGARALFGAPLRGRFVAGGLLGLAGVALMFWPEFGRALGPPGATAAPSAVAAAAAALTDAAGSSAAGLTRPGPAAAALGTAAASTRGGVEVGVRSSGLGVAYTAAAVLLSTVGSLLASRNRSRGLPFWPSFGYAMGYGALAAGLLALLSGHRLVLPAAPAWWLSLAWLALAGSVLAFACYLTLQDRLGPGPSSTVGVMTPLLALVVSLLFEAFEPALLTFAGAALAVVGNALMLMPAAGAIIARPEPAHR